MQYQKYYQKNLKKHKIILKHFYKINFNTIEYKFLEIIEKSFKEENILPAKGLFNLHKIKSYELFERKNDQCSIWHKCFYKKIIMKTTFIKNYKKLIRKKIKPRYKEKIIYQKIPTFRIHLPNNVAVGEFHKDKYYRNQKWSDEVKELNYFLPLTKAFKSNTIWSETKEDKGDFQPIEANYGDCIEWNGSQLTHGNKKNKTNYTRVSFDFRIIPKSRYKKSDYVSINKKTPFKIGGYYELM